MAGVAGFRPRQGNEGFVWLKMSGAPPDGSFRPRQGNEGFVSKQYNYKDSMVFVFPSPSGE